MGGGFDRRGGGFDLMNVDIGAIRVAGPAPRFVVQLAVFGDARLLNPILGPKVNIVIRYGRSGKPGYRVFPAPFYPVYI